MHERERGFLLIDVIIVTAIVAISIASAGTFFFGNLGAGVAAATIDVTAVLDEARETAMAMDSATVVFANRSAGRGFTATVYERVPGDPHFRPRNGPMHESAAAIAEGNAPLGAPGFALSVDRRGSIVGYKNFTVADTVFTTIACPTANAFLLRIGDRREARTVSVPCRLAASTTSVQSVATALPALTSTPSPAGTCPSLSPCTPAPIVASSATCPAGYAPVLAAPGSCDPIAVATCPPGSTGTPPVCVVAGGPTPAPTARALFSVAIAGCGSVRTSDIASVSAIQRDADLGAFVTYADAFGATATHVCGARDETTPD